MFSKHIFHLLLTVPCPHLSYSPPPCSFGPRFNSLGLYYQLVYYLNLKPGERNEIIEVLSAINPVWHYFEQTDSLEISMGYDPLIPYVVSDRCVSCRSSRMCSSIFHLLCCPAGEGGAQGLRLCMFSRGGTRLIFLSFGFTLKQFVRLITKIYQ